MAGGLLGNAGDLARQGLRGLGGAGERGGGRFELHGRGRDVGDDGADRGLEIVGKADQLGTAGCAGLLVLGFVSRGIALGLGDRLNLELFHRTGHVADLVLAAEARQHDVEIAGRQLPHRLAHRDHRPRDAVAQQQGPDDADDDAAKRQHQDKALGVADRRTGFGLDTLLIGRELRAAARLDSLRMVAADLVISPFILTIDLHVVGQLGEGGAVLLQEVADLGNALG